jgi:hypothetical protein
MRLPPGVLQELPVHFTATSHPSLHAQKYITVRILQSARAPMSLPPPARRGRFGALEGGPPRGFFVSVDSKGG